MVEEEEIVLGFFILYFQNITSFRECFNNIVGLAEENLLTSHIYSDQYDIVRQWPYLLTCSVFVCSFCVCENLFEKIVNSL